MKDITVCCSNTTPTRNFAVGIQGERITHEYHLHGEIFGEPLCSNKQDNPIVSRICHGTNKSGYVRCKIV